MFIGTFIFALYDATGKWLTSGYTAWEILALNRVLPLLWMMKVAHTQQGLSKTFSAWSFHLWRSLAIWATAACFFLSVTYIPLAQAIAICFLAPIFIVALAKPILKEEVSRWIWIALLLGLGGSILISFSGIGDISWAALLALAAAIFYAASILLLRLLPQSQSNTNVLFFNNFVMCSASLPLAILYWQTPTFIDGILIISMGGMGFAAQYFINIAYRGGPTSLIASIEYMALPYAVILGFLLWQDVPNIVDIIGASLILSGNLLISCKRSNPKI